jgi:uncharacterized protein YbjT (DUF2867 family)
MRVVVAGATGNLGTSVLQALGREPGVESVLGIARRLPQVDFARTDWAQADISKDDLVPLFQGATPWSTSRGSSSPHATSLHFGPRMSSEAGG